MSSRIVVLSMCYALLGAVANAGDSRESSVDDDVQEAIVRIRDRTDGSQGSGFVIGRDRDSGVFVLTCDHVVDAGHKHEIDFHPHGSYETTGIRVVARDAARDLALLHVRHAKQPSCLLPEQHVALFGRERASVIGFPSGRLARTNLRVLREFHARTSDLDAHFLLLDDVSAPGASGSPVLCPCGEHGYHLVGVYHGQAGNKGWASCEISEFLIDHSFDRLVHHGSTVDDRWLDVLLSDAFSTLILEVRNQ